MNNTPQLNSLVNDINGTTSFLSRLISRKTGVVILLLLSAAIFVKLVLL